jgi:hypothetical protein
VKEKLLISFYLHALDYHCRRGLRLWCTCEYCQTRIAGTRYIGHNTFYAYGSSYDSFSAWPSAIISSREQREERREEYLYAKGYDNCIHQDFEDYIRSGIERERERKRQWLRAELRELKEKAL